MDKRKVISIFIDKGGCGKTTVTINLGKALKELGYNVLLIDCNDRPNLSEHMGFLPDGKPNFPLLIQSEAQQIDYNPAEAIRHNKIIGVDYIPSDIFLNAAITVIGSIGMQDKGTRLISNMLARKAFEKYDYILFDCKNSFDNVITSVLSAGNCGVVVPVQVEQYAFDGLSEFVHNITIGSNSKILGFLPNMVHGSMSVHKDTLNELKDEYGPAVFKTYISRRAEAINAAKAKDSVFMYRNGVLKEQFLSVAKEIVERCGE